MNKYKKFISIKALFFFSLMLFFQGFNNSFAGEPAKTQAPKNIIIMIGDGMGFNHLDAGMKYMFGRSNGSGFTLFPVCLASATYPAKAGTSGEDGALDWAGSYSPNKAWKDWDYVLSGYTCSAASATALATGVKTYNGAIGLDLTGRPLKNLTERAKEIGKSAGVVTTVPLSHATPAGFVAHNKHRDNYSQIATEMLLQSKLDVIIGCGNPYYDHNGQKLEQAWSYKYVGDSLIWKGLNEGKTDYSINGNKIKLADCDFDGKPDAWTLIQDVTEFKKLGSGQTPKRLLGVAKAAETLQQRRGSKIGDKYGTEGREDAFTVPFNKNLPDLATMTKAALNVLDNNKKGFFVMIEGGAIDWASHSNQPGRLIEEFKDFYSAVDSVVNWVNTNSSWDETLVIVTADHETGYLTGKGSGGNPPVWNSIPRTDKGKMPEMEFHTGGHTNSLVPVYAKGKGADLLELYADETDQKRGRYILNSEIPQLVFMLWGK